MTTTESTTTTAYHKLLHASCIFQHITDILSQLETWHNASGLKWNALAVRKAVTSLKQCPYTIRTVAQAKSLIGVGDR